MVRSAWPWMPAICGEGGLGGGQHNLFNLTISCCDRLYITYTKLCDTPTVLSSSTTDIGVVVISDENAFGTTADEG